MVSNRGLLGRFYANEGSGGAWFEDEETKRARNKGRGRAGTWAGLMPEVGGEGEGAQVKVLR
jgi:hypothetical protein